tara:strand:+ start:63 stop:695 length:633 start_codon:yes stop_codon:yes gene_type:complete
MTVSWVMTYNSLNTMVLQYLERSDAAVVEAIPTFITLAEFEIAQQIKTLGQMQVVVSTMEIGNPVIQKPARWRKTVSMEVSSAGAKSPVLLRKYEYLKSYTPDATSTGLPLFYADYDYDHWLVAPTPDQAYPFEVLYYERIAPLSSENQTNWITQNAPNAMLFGTLLQAMPFLKNDARQIFQQKYQEALASLKAEDVTRVGDRQAIAVDS